MGLFYMEIHGRRFQYLYSKVQGVFSVHLDQICGHAMDVAFFETSRRCKQERIVWFERACRPFYFFIYILYIFFIILLYIFFII